MCIRDRLEQELNRNTPLSQLAHQVALIIAVGIFLVVVFDARRYLLGGSSISMYTIMLASLVIVLGTATLAKKQPGSDR